MVQLFSFKHRKILKHNQLLIFFLSNSNFFFQHYCDNFLDVTNTLYLLIFSSGFIFG